MVIFHEVTIKNIIDQVLDRRTLVCPTEVILGERMETCICHPSHPSSKQIMVSM